MLNLIFLTTGADFEVSGAGVGLGGRAKRKNFRSSIGTAAFDYPGCVAAASSRDLLRSSRYVHTDEAASEG